VAGARRVGVVQVVPGPPIDRIASGQKFVALPCPMKGRSPIMWQIELIDHVMWCSNPTRISPAQ
jgi:hypothetical protein